MSTVNQFRAVILGTAVGDALGLPREGLSRRRAGRMFDGPPLRHRLIVGRGLCSDDTEHTCMVGQALLVSGGDPRKLARSLSWRLRWWFVGLPAGVGMATAKACIKLWMGFPPHRSGVWSAGNGPAMRAAIIGVYASHDIVQLRELVAVSTRITHSDPAAQHGALAIALAAAHAVQQKVTPASYLDFVRPELAGTEMLQLIEQVVDWLQKGATFESYLESQSLAHGISGYINHTVPAAIYAWLASPEDFRKVVESVICAGGDADSTGAIAGALAAITAGVDSIPREWIDGIIEWPRSVAWMNRLAAALEAAKTSSPAQHRPTALLWPAILVRNVLFLIIVLLHGMRRLLPPY